MDEDYKITESDILMISFILNIPIVLLYQSKNQLKMMSFTKYNKYDFKYYIKATNQNMLYLYSCKKSLKIKNDSIKQTLLDDINEQSVNKFEDYIVKRHRKIILNAFMW